MNTLNTAPIQSAELAELRKLAEAATPGPWEHDQPENMVGKAIRDGTWMLIGQARSVHVPKDQRDANGAYIAAANPATILRLRAAIAAPSPAHDRASCCLHDSDCAVHNAPALPVGPCDCTLAPAPAQQASSDLPEGWRDVLEKVRDGICAGGLAEYATHERSIVGPYLDAVYDELAALEEEAAAQEQAKPTLDIEQVFALSRQVKPTDLQAVPDGWKLVPVAVTEEMHAAAVKTIIRCLGNDDFPPKVYAAMLAAAPTPPAARELTDAEIVRIADEIGLSYRTGRGIKLFARAIERALSGNTAAKGEEL